MLLVLGGGTLLAAQVQGDLDAGVQDVQGGMDLGTPDDPPPLKLNDFKLPSDIPLEIPEGAIVSPDLSKLTLPEDMELDLPSDLDLSNLDFELPEDFDLQLPEGSLVTPSGIDLPNGGSIRLPDGRSFDLPEGSHLDIPSSLADALRREGIPSGTPLAFPTSVPIRGLPEGTHARLDPPQFSGGGSLRLPAGTTITLPDGQRFTLPAGALAAAASYLLPAGTTFDIPWDAVGNAGGTFPVPQPYSSSQIAGRTPTTTGSGFASGARGIAVDTEITEMPSRVRKGEPVVVGGYVRELATGRAVAGAPVDVFLNETKRAPGQLVGQGVTGSNGVFRITLTLPDDKPAANYQLVNHASSFVDASGRLFADGWGDPPLATYASTVLTLQVPSRDGLGSRTPISGALVDHTGAPVAGLSVMVSVDGTAIGYPVTSATGTFALQHVFASGTHRVDARFSGTSNYESSAAKPANITITEHVLEIPATVRAKPGGTLVLSGRLLSQGAAVPDRTIQIAGLPFGSSSLTAVTDLSGRFSTTLAVPSDARAGQTALRYTFPEFAIDKQQTLELNESGRLRLDAPSAWDVELPFFANVQLVSDTTGQPIASQPVRLTLAGPGGVSEVLVTTDATGTASASLTPLRATAGAYTLTARAIGPPQLQVSTVSAPVDLGLFEVVWEAPETLVRGQEAAIEGTVRFAGRPYALMPVTLDALDGPVARTTDASGRFSWSATLPRDTPVGPAELTLNALDHPERSERVTVIAASVLELDAPQEFAAGEAVRMGVRLKDDVGEPIRDSLVTLTAVTPSGTQRTIVKTDRDGRWEGPMNVTASVGQNVTVSARFDAAGPYLATAATETMSATAPVVKGPLSPLLWIVPLAVVLGGAGVGGAWWYARKRAARTVTVPVVAATPVAAAPVMRAPDLEVRFGIPADEPAVWGVGEPLELTVRDHGPGGEIELAWQGGARRVALAPGAEARATLTFPEEGEVVVTARRVARSDVEPTSAAVRIVDYPKETAREFDLFLERAKELDGRISKRSTPREIQWTLAEHLGGEAEQRLEEIALVIELTNYSNDQTSRSRAHYLRFVRAARALDPFFAPRARPREPGV